MEGLVRKPWRIWVRLHEPMSSIESIMLLVVGCALAAALLWSYIKHPHHVSASYSPNTNLVTWLCQPASASSTAYDCSTNLTLLDGTVISNTAPVKGQLMIVIPDQTNTASFTIKTDGVAAITASYYNAGIGAAVNNFGPNEVLAGVPVTFVYNGGSVKTRRWLLAQGIPRLSVNNGIDCTGDNWDLTCSIDTTANLNVKGLSTTTNCSSSASPAVCVSAPAGSVAVAAGSNTLVVNTTAVTSNSQIFLMFDAGLGPALGVTCNAAEPALYGVTGRTAATSFTITSSIPVTNPACFNYFIVN
jgi:hypothetical protein